MQGNVYRNWLSWNTNKSYQICCLSKPACSYFPYQIQHIMNESCFISSIKLFWNNKKRFPWVFCWKTIICSPKKTLALLQWCSYISNLELNHIDIKDNLPMVKRLKYLNIYLVSFGVVASGFFVCLGFFMGFFRGERYFWCCWFFLDLFLETGQRNLVMKKFIAISGKSKVWDRTLSLAEIT